MTPLTVPEARAILRADEALDATFKAREASGTTLGLEEAEAWMALVESANDRIAAYEGTRKGARPESDRYPGSNEPDFQSRFHRDAAAKRPAALDSDVQELRVGIETILKAFGTDSAEWAQQFRELLDRVPAKRPT